MDPARCRNHWRTAMSRTFTQTAKSATKTQLTTVLTAFDRLIKKNPSIYMRTWICATMVSILDKFLMAFRLLPEPLNTSGLIVDQVLVKCHFKKLSLFCLLSSNCLKKRTESFLCKLSLWGCLFPHWSFIVFTPLKMLKSWHKIMHQWQ